MPNIIARYTTKKGDNLSKIARNYYGSEAFKYLNLIMETNKDIIKDKDVIIPGQVIRIPELPLSGKKK